MEPIAGTVLNDLPWYRHMWPEENQIVLAEEPDMYWKWKATLLVMKRIESGIVCKYQMIVKNRDSLFGTYTYTPFVLVCWEAVHTGTQASSTARYRNDLVLVVVVAVFVSHPGSKRRRRLTPPNSKSMSPQLKKLPCEPSSKRSVRRQQCNSYRLFGKGCEHPRDSKM